MQYFEPVKNYYYLSFSKTPGLRFTEITLQSTKHLLQQDAGDTFHFKLVPLFKEQKLDVKNCILEIEVFMNKVPPQNFLFQNYYVDMVADKPFQLPK